MHSISLPTAPKQIFQCQGKVYCSEMRSREEAEFYLDNCPGTKMDGDYDGIPCEKQF
ncbi:excalibur calcium-binding domain-containing protein [Methylomonas sp. MO1]|uniref:excalibur calcium-binding domain-containing protein n=1 Tax=Methylomonas sp. MO1 TaxID=3073619 RepID=UPI0028A3EC4F|nr:excalibur calcium-binding domain-containing protein [Methylomonas sp. MO1]MDT4288445.1 excalibur calcium-binding domain-containing protein [Methylomonas sp. MO1]